MSLKNKRDKAHDDHFKKMIYLDKKKIILGSYSSYEWANDPKHLIFSLSRYKFVSKMLSGKNRVLEIGAGDGFKSRVVDTEVKKLDLCDVTQSSKNQFKSSNMNKNDYFIHDFTKKKFNRMYDAIYSLDVIEHIKRSQCSKFINNIKSSIKPRGILIIGCPSQSSQKYASKYSKKFHVNCFDKDKIQKYLSGFFKNVF